MRYNYLTLITEPAKRFNELEGKHRNSVIATRMRMMRLLKEGKAQSMRQVAEMVHYSMRQCQRWFKSYQEKGLDALLEERKTSTGRPELMTEEAWEKLNEALGKGEIASYAQARELLAECNVIYSDDTGIGRLFKRYNIKAKVGRPQHEKADIAAQEELKKTLLSG